MRARMNIAWGNKAKQYHMQHGGHAGYNVALHFLCMQTKTAAVNCFIMPTKAVLHQSQCEQVHCSGDHKQQNITYSLADT